MSCKHCDPKEPKDIPQDKGGVKSTVRIDWDGGPHLKAFDAYGYNWVRVPINRCPMCGRDLREAE